VFQLELTGRMRLNINFSWAQVYEGFTFILGKILPHVVCKPVRTRWFTQQTTSFNRQRTFSTVILSHSEKANRVWGLFGVRACYDVVLI
jgi:hypothetical protein